MLVRERSAFATFAFARSVPSSSAPVIFAPRKSALARIRRCLSHAFQSTPCLGSSLQAAFARGAAASKVRRIVSFMGLILKQMRLPRSGGGRAEVAAEKLAVSAGGLGGAGED